MKKTFTTIALSIATAIATGGFSQEAPINQPSANLKTELKSAEKLVSKKSFGYARLGISDKDAINTIETVPGLGLGYRYGLSHSALDVSVNYTSQVANRKFYETYFYTAPKVSYLRYVSNDTQPESFYYGVGLAWGGLKKSEESNFTGVISSATVGYEMNRNQDWHSFVQLDVSQPTAVTAASWAKPISFENLPGPLAEVSVGFGY